MAVDHGIKVFDMSAVLMNDPASFPIRLRGLLQEYRGFRM